MFDHWQRLTLLDVLLSPLVGGVKLLLAPESRMYWPYLVVSLFVAFFFWRKEKQTVKDLPPELDVFSRLTWTSQSALNDYGLVTVNALLFVFFLGVLLPNVSHWVPIVVSRLGSASAPILDINPFAASVLLAAALFLVEDFLRFFAHWLEHRVPVLWELHKVHHSATVLNFLTADRQHPVSVFFSSVLISLGAILVNVIFVVCFGKAIKPAFWLGANVFWVTSNFLASSLRHSPVWISFGPSVERWLISPAQHQIHHSDKPEHFDRNFGSTLAVWDRAIGTLYLTTSIREPLHFGLGAESDELKTFGSMYFRPLKRIFFGK
jgi:sterol desaturase/sphingolipid hydroxylase (fatty acid hydroxylase superfamily)